MKPGPRARMVCPFATTQPIACLLAVLLSAASCETIAEGGGDGGTHDDSGADDARIEPNDKPLPTDLVKFVGPGESAEFDVTATQQKFLVVAYSVSKAVSEGISFSLDVQGTEGSTGSSEAKLNQGTRRVPLAERDPRRARLIKLQQQSERRTRRWREEAANGKMVAPPADRFIQGSSCQTSADCGAKEVCLTASQSCSSTVELNTSQFSAAEEPLQTEVMEKGEKVAILVDTSVAEQVSASALTELRQAFDQKIYARDVALFGDPPLQDGSATLASDRNGDGLVWLVLTPRVSDEAEAVGFFVATDFLVKGDGQGQDPSANEADILYAMPPGVGDTKLEDILPTMAHEFQHLLSFAQKVYRARVDGGAGALEALWLDEGLSHLAEDLCGYGAGNVTLLAEETIPVFSETSLIPPVDAEGRQVDSRQMRGMALLFLRYLFEQKGGVRYDNDGSIVDLGGATWLASIPATSAQGRAAIEQTYGDFKTAFERWVLTVALDGRDVTDSPLLRYADLIVDPTPPGNTIGLRLADADDPSGAPVLARPLAEDLALATTEDVIPSTSAKYYLLTLGQGTASVGLQTDESDLFVAVVALN